MSRIKTGLSGALSALILASPASAFGDLWPVFAQCAGRYSAELEHAWLMGDRDAAMPEERRAYFIALVEGAMPVGAGSEALDHRISAKFAQAALLQSAAFDESAEARDRAADVARAHIQSCGRLLLGG